MGKVRGPLITRDQVKRTIVDKAGGEGVKLEKFIRSELAQIFNNWVQTHNSQYALEIKRTGTIIDPLDLYQIKGVVDLYINVEFERIQFEQDLIYQARYDTVHDAIESRMRHLGNLLDLSKTKKE